MDILYFLLDPLYLLLVLLLLISLAILNYLIRTYNLLVNLRMDVERQASHVEVHLKKKFDLIPALVKCVEGYAKHEKSTLEEVVRLRSHWGQSKGQDERIKNANMLEAALSKLLIIQERYPELKANKSFNASK